MHTKCYVLLFLWFCYSHLVLLLAVFIGNVEMIKLSDFSQLGSPLPEQGLTGCVTCSCRPASLRLPLHPSTLPQAPHPLSLDLCTCWFLLLDMPMIYDHYAPLRPSLAIGDSLVAQLVKNLPAM